MNQRKFAILNLFQLGVYASGLLLLLAGCPVTLPTINQNPTANAGADITIDAGQRVTLDGLETTDADDDPLTFSWQQQSGPFITLDGANTAQPSFVPGEEGSYEFVLTVTDGRGGSDISVVRIFVEHVDIGLPNVLFEDDFEADDCLGQWIVGGRQLEGVNIANCEERGESTRGHLFKSSFTEITLTPDVEPFPFSDDLVFNFDMEVRVTSTGGVPSAFYGQSSVGFAFYNAEGDLVGNVSYSAATTSFPYDSALNDSSAGAIPIATNVDRSYSLTVKEILSHIAIDDSVASVGMAFRTYSSTRPNPSVEAELWIDNIRVTSGDK